MKITPIQLKQELSTIIDVTLANMVVNAYLDTQQRYYAGEWEPAELNGGKFCEVVARAFYQLDAGQTVTELPGRVSEMLKDKNNRHALDFKDRDHFCRVLGTAYKFRSDRGIAHISATYTANHLDATLVVAEVKWLFAEFLRLAWKDDRDEIASVIESIVQLEHPLIFELDGRPLVLFAGLTAAEELLIILHHSPGGRLSREKIKQYVRATSGAIDMAIGRLQEAREIDISEAKEIAITPLGEKRMREGILPKTSANSAKKPIGTKRKPPMRSRKSTSF